MMGSRRSKSLSRDPKQFAAQQRVALPGSEKAAAANAVRLKPTPTRSKVTVSVILRRKEPLKINLRGGRAAGPVRVSRAEYKKHHAADPDAIKQIRAFAREYQLKVEPDPASTVRRTVRLSGRAADVQKAFGVTLEQKTIDGD